MLQLQTKSSRLQSRQLQFDSLINKGYKQTTYKGLDFFTCEDGNKFTLKVFRGTSTNAVEYCNYRTEERRNEVIENYKSNYERHLLYKQEQKAKGYTSSHAGAAAAIKAELKEAFPGIRFSVTSESFSMGDSVRIHWEDGPTEKEVEEYSRKYQYGHFNGMEDLYENTNSRDDIPQSKYVQTSRNMSAALNQLLTPDSERLFVKDHYIGIHYASNFLHQIFYHCSIPAGAIVTGIIPTGKDSGMCSPETFFTIGFTLPETKQDPKPANNSTNEVIPGTVQIIEYGKGIAVIGETKAIRHILGKGGLNGIFQPRLSCGPGWIFPKSRMQEVAQALNLDKINQEVTEMEESAQLYETLQDIEQTENGGGKVISLFNYSKL